MGRLQRAQAERLLQSVVGLAKVQGMYPEGHTAEDRARKGLAEVLREVLPGGEGLLLGCRDGYLVVGDVPFIGAAGSAQDLERWLTAREIEVLEMVADGKTSREIGDLLFISENTVKNHIRNILDKLGLHSRNEAVLYAVRENLIAL